MTREELEAEIGPLGRAINQALNEGRPPAERVGFVLLLFDFGADGSFSYLSNADRADVVRFLKEAREKIGAETQ